MNRSLESYLKEFYGNGVVIIPESIECDQVNVLRKELLEAVDLVKNIRPDVFDAGMVHNCMFHGEAMRELLDLPDMNEFVARILGKHFLIYAYQSSSLFPESGGVNYGSRPHVDSPRFIQNYITNVGVIFALDDFTEENGATYYIQGSHLSKELLNDNEFYKSAKRLLCKSGDMIVFSGRLQHAAGKNLTDKSRNALTINFCRSYMRQRFDFPKMISREEEILYSENTKKLLGWNVRMPSSLDEFYLPEAERLYKPNQG